MLESNLGVSHVKMVSDYFLCKMLINLNALLSSINPSTTLLYDLYNVLIVTLIQKQSISQSISQNQG